MRTDQLKQELLALQPALQQQGVVHMAIFGSRARGDYSNHSDLDVLIEVADNTRFSILDLATVQHMVFASIGIEAYAVMRRSLKDKFRNEIMPDAIEIF